MCSEGNDKSARLPSFLHDHVAGIEGLKRASDAVHPTAADGRSRAGEVGSRIEDANLQNTLPPPPTVMVMAFLPSRTVTAIDKNWSFKQANAPESDYLPVAQFPTNIHLDLLHHNLIPDPFIGKNENAVQWVGERGWTYRTRFLSPPMPAQAVAVLAFDGLDTIATVVLNGETILESDNMFTPARVDVTNLIRADTDGNELVIRFDSAYLTGWKRVEQHAGHKWGCWNGDNSRLAVRKAQYHWGWDWGPKLLTCGPWRPVRLEVYRARVADLSFRVTVDDHLSSAELVVHAEIEGAADRIRFDVRLDHEAVASETRSVRAGRVSVSFRIHRPALWYPVGYGKQSLYHVSAALFCRDDELDRVSRKTGLRRAEVVRQPLGDQPGTSFFFRINKVPIFSRGCNWIPADSFLPRVDGERYHDWVRLAVAGRQNMIRVWGGGIYEDQALYEVCDEAGVMIWQDFMFACGNYPTWPTMLASIEAEARANLTRLRHHPSIVIWTGNNEDYQYRESAGLTYDYQDKDPDSWLRTDFPARFIYEKLLADVCTELVPDTYYQPGSPWKENRETADRTVGDLHQWNVWHGSQERYQDWDKLAGRFVSEFGMQAFPSVRTVDAYLVRGGDDPDRYSQSSTVDFHNKAAGHDRRMALYLAENIRYDRDPLEHFVYSSQLMQAECLASAYRLWRRQWKGPGREYCSGALVWQLNDCWPATSWAVADYYMRPKLAYFAVRRELADLTVGIVRRQDGERERGQGRVKKEVQTKMEVWASNLTLADVTVDCVLKAWHVDTGELQYQETVRGRKLPENRATELVERTVPASDSGDQGRTVVAAYLIRDGEQVARSVNWPEPLKYLHLQKPKDLRVVFSEEAEAVDISADVPVKGLGLETDQDGLVFDDNLIDLVPGERIRIGVRGARKDSKVKTRYLGYEGW